jgi:hypothetical protein
MNIGYVKAEGDPLRLGVCLSMAKPPYTIEYNLLWCL